MPSRARLLIVPALSLALAACALNSPPKPEELRAQAIPNLHPPAAWTAQGVTSASQRTDWLADFGDPQLTALVNEAIAYNSDLRIAAARVEMAAAQAKLAGSAVYPAVNAIAHGGGKSGGDGSGVNAVGIFAHWELDLWGRARYAGEAGRLGFEAASLDAEYARQSIAALVTKSWLLAIQAGLQRSIADEIVRSSEQFGGLARDRLRVGPGDEYDVALAEANVDTARDAARQLALGQEQALRALETLVGRYPASELRVRTALPRMPGPVPVGLPSELLERRPDVIAAERRVAAAFNAVGEAKAARLPKIALTASVSAISSDLFVLQNHSNPVAAIGGNIVWPLFNGYALDAQVDIRNAEQALAVADYGRIATRAFSEVESALSAGFAADEREVILARAVQSNSRTLDLAQVRYRVGSGDLRGVLQQNIALYGTQTALLQVQAERRIQRVNLYLAVGGALAPPPQASLDPEVQSVAGVTRVH